jgi:ferric iron reductase protein FhuF
VHTESSSEISIDVDLKMKMTLKLIWLSKTSQYFVKKYNQKELSHSRKHYDNIPRNSYKFCNFGYTCKYNSNKQKCYGQHFVFNLIKSDIDEVVYHLENAIEINIKEICISLNTISFVFNHMYDEMDKIIIDKSKSLVSQKVKHA